VCVCVFVCVCVCVFVAAGALTAVVDCNDGKNGGCEQSCSEGSCQCPVAGFTLSAANRRTCVGMCMRCRRQCGLAVWELLKVIILSETNIRLLHSFYPNTYKTAIESEISSALWAVWLGRDRLKVAILSTRLFTS